MQAKPGCVELRTEETSKLTRAGGEREELRAVPQFVSALKQCSKTRDLTRGKMIYREAAAQGYHTNNYVAANLITMFSRCRSMDLAQQVFDEMNQRDVVTWNSLILGYTDNGKSLEAFKLFLIIDCEPTTVTYIAALKACGRLTNEAASGGGKVPALQKGRSVHQLVERHGLVSDILVATSLVDMYSKCGSMERARETFDKMTSLSAVSWNALILGYLNNGDLMMALDLFIDMDCEPNTVTYVAVLKVYGCLAAERESRRQEYLEKVTGIKKQVQALGLDSDVSVSTALLSALWKCGSLALAKDVFDNMAHRDVVAWNSLIIGYVEHGKYFVAMDLLAGMTCRPNSVTCVTGLKACGSMANENVLHKCFCIEKGMEMYKSLNKADSDTAVANALIDLCSRCGNMKLSRAIFDSLSNVNVITWTSLILGYMENGGYLAALELFTVMNCEPNAVTFVAAIRAWGGMAAGTELEMEFCLEKGAFVHKQAKDRGFHSDSFVLTTLVDMYSKCGNMQMAREVFDGMTIRNTVAWNALLHGYVNNGMSWLALEMLDTMDCKQDHVTFVAALMACGSLVTQDESPRDFLFEYGVGIHKFVDASGCNTLGVVATALVDFYGKYGRIHRAKEIFDRMESWDTVAWNALILGYVDSGAYMLALELYDTMDCKRDGFTFTAGLKACGGLGSKAESEKEFCLQKGVLIHEEVKSSGCIFDQVLANGLIDMYSKCGSLTSAREVFDGLSSRDVVTWNCFISGCMSNGHHMEALSLVYEMDCSPDSFTYVAGLKACGGLSDEREPGKQLCLEQGVKLHREILRNGFDKLAHVNNSLIDMYTRCGSMLRARSLFDSLRILDSITWNSFMLGYIDNREFTETVELFTVMDCQPNSSTFTHVLRACGSLGAFSFGQGTHAQVCRLGFEADPAVATSLMSFYGKCCAMNTAEVLFNTMQSPDKVAWGALMTAYSTLGETSQVLSMARRMKDAGFELDDATFACILTACSHAGLVERAELYFKSRLGFNISVSREHYNCMVDVLSRANRLEDALALITSMPFEATSLTWTTLLAGCRAWGNDRD